MKKIIRVFAAILCCTMTTAVFTACMDDRDDPTPVPISIENSDTPSGLDELPEYTIIYYSLGATSLEKFHTYSQFYQADPETFKKVNVVIQHKFSTTENMKTLEEVFDENTCETFGGKTVRWAVDPSKDYTEQWLDAGNIYGADNADVTCPDSLTSFINWAAKTYPAKKYMLILDSHGGGYHPNDELPETISAATRGLLYDGGYPVPGQQNKHFTAKSLYRGVAAADVRMEIIFFYACLMSNLEYVFELHDICDYIIGSTYTMISEGGAMFDLPVLLSQPDIPMDKKLDVICKSFVVTWEKFYIDNDYPDDYPVYYDLTVTRTAGIPHLGEMLREFTDRLCDIYANGTDAQRQAIDNCTAKAVRVESDRPIYDAVKYVKSLVDALPEVYGDDFGNRMKNAFNNCIVAQYFSKYLNVRNYMVDYSVLLGAEGAYSYVFWETDKKTGDIDPDEEIVFFDNGECRCFKVFPTDDMGGYERGELIKSGKWGSTLADTYEQLAFDRAVGWSRWLRLNQQWPNAFSAAGMEFSLPMPEDDSLK